MTLHPLACHIILAHTQVSRISLLFVIEHIYNLIQDYPSLASASLASQVPSQAPSSDGITDAASQKSGVPASSSKLGSKKNVRNLQKVSGYKHTSHFNTIVYAKAAFMALTISGGRFFSLGHPDLAQYAVDALAMASNKFLGMFSYFLHDYLFIF